jgi:hemerythrin-like domain-containing protein
MNWNKKIEDQIQEMEDEVSRLQRLDHRLNKTLVQKPYAYIDKIKEEINKEQKAIREIIMKNNDRMLQKIIITETKAEDLLKRSTELLESFRRKIDLISKNIENVKKFKSEIESSVEDL